MTRHVRIARPAGYECSPRGVRYYFPPGDYRVPDDMSPEIARRCLESGIGKEIRTKASPMTTKNGKAPAKKKRSTGATGKRAPSSRAARRSRKSK